MQPKNTFKKALSVVLLGGLLLSIGGVAMADTNNAKQVKKPSKTVTEKRMHSMERGANAPAKMQASIKTKLAALVTAGTITQEKADAVVAYFAKNEVDRTVNPISQLVTDGVLTQADADAIAKAMPQRGPDGRGQKGRGMERGPVDSAKMQTVLKAKLATLVTAGTITQVQSDKILAAFAQEQVKRTAEFAKIKAMTEAERQAYMKTVKVKRVNPINQLVTDGVLTQANADAISKAMPHRGPGHEGMRRK